MPDSNKSVTKVDDASEAVKSQEVKDSKNLANENTDSESKTVPLPTFLEMKDKVKELTNQLSEFQKQQEENKRKALEEQNKFKELYEETTNKLKEYEPDAVKYREYVNAKRDSAKEKLGDKWKDSYSSLPLSDLEDLVNALVEEKKAPPVDKSNTFTRKSAEIKPKSFREWKQNY